MAARKLNRPIRLIYDRATDKYLPIAWDDAFALIARHLHALPSPDMAAFYTSGRTSNEAAFLFQLAKIRVADARIEGLWENAPTPANDLTKVRWTE